MDKIKITVLCMLLLAGMPVWSQPAPPAMDDVFLGDPTIVYENGVYYMSGTNDLGHSADFPFYASNDLLIWRSLPSPLTVRSNSWGTYGLWAPQFYHLDNHWLMLYTANEQIAVAESACLNTSFTQTVPHALDISEKNIDPYLFKDDDGKYYLYHVRFNDGNYLWCGEFDISTMSLVSGTLSQCFDISQPWERTDALPRATVMEGPSVIKIDKKYYMFYSCNHFLSPDYAMGYAVADSPQGPWRKSADNPLLCTASCGEPGDGHGDVFKAADGKLYYVYHVHYSSTQARPRRTRIVELEKELLPNGEYKFHIDYSRIIHPQLLMQP